MPLVKLAIPPGVFRNGTEYQVAGRWYDSNLIRWINGLMMPVGGWARLTPSVFTGKCRAIFPWKANNFDRYMAYGTSSKLYVWNDSGTAYDITPTGFAAGRDDAIYGLGYGSLDYGDSTYGTARAGSGSVLDASTWTFDSWGQNLIGCAPHDGTIYQWALNTGVIAAVVSNAPVSNRGAFVTPERHLVALGAGGNPRKVQWSDAEDNTDWTPSATNASGSIELETSGSIMSAAKVRGVNLIFTDVDVHSMTHIGQPFVFSFAQAGNNCGLAAVNAFASVRSFCVWMTKNDFQIYDGSVRQQTCDVQDYVFGDLNRMQISKVVAGVNSANDEIWWFYPSADSEENDRYVAWNFREDHWAIGTLARTAWCDSTIRKTPTAAGADNYLYDHEQGYTNNGAALMATRFAQSGAVEVGTGERAIVARQVIPDEATQGQTKLVFKTRMTPNGAESSHGPYSMSDYTDVRFTGRQFAIRVEGNADADWRFGTPRLEAVPGSGR